MFGPGHRTRFGNSEIARDLKVAGEITYMCTLEKGYEKDNVKLSDPPKADRRMFGTPLPGASFRAYSYADVHLTSQASSVLGKAHIVPQDWNIKVLDRNTLKAHKSFSKAERVRGAADTFFRERLQSCYTIMHKTNLARFAKWAVITIMGEDGKLRSSSNTNAIIDNMAKEQFASGLIGLIRRTHNALREKLKKK